MKDWPGWDYVLLGELRSGYEKRLPQIIDAIYQTKGDTPIVNPKLFKVEPRWGGRLKFVHVVRSAMSRLRKRGMVEHIGTIHSGIYRITRKGLDRLEALERNL